MGNDRAQELQGVAAPRPTLLTATEAVARVERAIVGNALTRDPAVAEGLALAGARAASMSTGLATSSAGDLRTLEASCVHHVTGAPGHGPHDAAFEFAATSAQEAADHCLAAHILSEKLGRPGVCSIGTSLADDLALLRLPDAEAMADRLAIAGDRERDAHPERIVELAREALATAGGAAGVSEAAVSWGSDNAKVVLVATGAAAAAAQAAARMLVEADIPARSLSLILLRPLPVAEIRNALGGARWVFAVGEPGGVTDSLLVALRAAVAEKGKLQTLEATEANALIAAMSGHLAESGFDISRLVAPDEPPLRRRLVVAPESRWGEKTARNTLALLSQRGPVRIGRRARHHVGAVLIGWSGDATADDGPDLLLATHHAALDPDGALALIRPGSAVLLLSHAATAPELMQQLSPEARATLRKRNHRVYWLGLADSEARTPAPGDDESATSLALAAAAVAVIEDPGAAVAADLDEAEGQPDSGLQKIHSLGPDDLASAPTAEEIDFRSTPNLLRIPDAVDVTGEDVNWAHWLSRFHRTGAASGEPAGLRPLLPAALAALSEEIRGSAAHPFVLVAEGDSEVATNARSLRDLLRDGLASVQAGGHGVRVLTDHLESLLASATRQLARCETGTALDELLADLGDGLAKQLGLGGDETRGLQAEIEALRAALPAGCLVFDLRPDTPLRLYMGVLSAVRAPLERSFAKDLAKLRDELRDRLQLDHMSSAAGHSPEALTSELGATATRHLDLGALAQNLPASPGWATLGEPRRHCIEAALGTIESHLDREDPLPPAVFLVPPGVELHLRDVQQRVHPDPLAASVGYFDGAAHSMAELFAAVRRARLLLEGTYRPEIHDEPLAGLDWEAFTADELALLPAVTVVTTGRRLRQRGQSSLSELLRSSRPVRVLVHDDVAAADEADDLSLFHIDLGQLVMAHRETFAISTTLARPEPLVERLVRMFQEPRPGVLLAQLAAGAPAPWRPLLAEAALRGRACPDFLYDPEAGPSWADRFNIDGNPDPERAWPLQHITCLEDGNERTLEIAFTFADAVALEPAYLRHLRLIPRVAWQDEGQVPLATYVENFEPGKAMHQIPFLWVVDDARMLQRVVVTQELAMACRDRLRSWRVLQEFGGFENAYAERAAATAREAALEEAARERAELTQAHTEALADAQAEGARESMKRLAATLLNRDPLAAGSIGTTAAPAVPATTTPTAPSPEVAAEPPAPQEPEDEEPALSLDEPYIDAIMCTSCNECTNLNSRLFQYNGDKQAYIADASAGTFAELVKAAVLCPAKCIHPGKPRSDDDTATPELIARAAEFN